MFRRTVVALICALLLVVAFSGAQEPTSQISSHPATDGGSTKVLLADGTPIKLRLKQDVSSAGAKTGDVVDFEVLEDVKVGEAVVIPRGNPAIGTVTAVLSARRMGRAGKLNIELDYVRLADGQKATLRAVEEMKGESHVGTSPAEIGNAWYRAYF
jgi:hypothetical protein